MNKKKTLLKQILPVTVLALLAFLLAGSLFAVRVKADSDIGTDDPAQVTDSEPATDDANPDNSEPASEGDVDVFVSPGLDPTAGGILTPEQLSELLEIEEQMKKTNASNPLATSNAKGGASYNDLDEILNYTITVDVNEDATLHMVYRIDWKVLNSTKEGPLSWVLIGVPNSHCKDIKARSSTIKKIKYTTDRGGSFVRIDLDREYKAGEIVNHWQLKKDIWPLILQYGVMRFPLGTDACDKVVFTTMGLKGHGECVMVEQ